MHPHEQEEREYQETPHPNSGQYMADEAKMGASWQTEEWNSEHPWLLTSGDFWVSNPHYHGPPCPHPEEYPHTGDKEACAEFDLYWARVQSHWKDLNEKGLLEEYYKAWHDAHTEQRIRFVEEDVCDDDIPF